MNMFIELSQPPQQEGQPIQKLKALIHQINFAFKQPLQPVFMVAIGGVVMPCIGNYEDVVSGLGDEGFTVLDTPEGSKAVVNPEHILFFMNLELGLYNLMFDGKAGLTVKATTAEIEGMFTGGPPIIQT